jgi:hypothetical protein
MQRLGRLRKGFLYVLIFLVVASVGLVVCARLYLNSNRVTSQVANRLQSLLGGKVEVGQADIGLHGGSTLHDLRAFEEGASANSPAWLHVSDVSADLSALSLLRGESMPTHIDLHGAEVHLRFDREGHLLTRLPASKEHAARYPSLRLDGGKLTLDQEGRAPMVIQNVAGELTSGDSAFQIKGTVNDPRWGDWALQGSFDLKAGDYALTMDTSDVEISPEKLKSLPYVPAKVWREVEAQGHTPARVAFRYHQAAQAAHYRIDLDPASADWITVPSISLRATKVRGKIVVEDEVVKLTGVTGQAAKGAMAVTGDLDFRGAVSKLQFGVKVNDLVLHDLPQSWGVREKTDLDGKLTGSADLVLLIDDKGVRTRGKGEGLINDARWGKINFLPIHLELYATGKGFGFRHKAPVGKAALKALAAFALVGAARPAQAPPPADWRLSPERAIAAVPEAVGYATNKLVDGAGAVLHQLNRWAKPLAPGEQPSLLEADLGLEDVDLSLLVQQAGLKLPFDLQGRLSIQMHVGIPIDTPRDLRAYRLRGDATFSRLSVAGFAMADVKAKVHYVNGVLDLEDLTGRVPQPPRPAAPANAGTFAGTARYEVVPEGNVSADLRVQDVPLDRALDALPRAAGQAAGNLSGSVNASVPAAKVRDPAAWRVKGSLSAPQVRLYGLALKDFAADLALADGRATVTGLKANLEGAPVTGSAEARLAGAWPFEARLDLGRMDLAAVERLAPSVRPPVAVTGTVRLTASADGTLQPVNVNAKGTAHADGLVVDGVKFDALSFNFSEGAAGLSLEAIKAKLYEGQITGSAVVPVRPAQAGKVDLKVESVDVQRLARSLPRMPVRLEGKVSGSVTGKITAAAADKPRAVTTDVELTAPTLRVQGIPAQRLNASVEYRAGAADYRLTGETLGGKFRLQGKLPPRNQAAPPAPPPPQGRLEVEGVRLARLWAALRMGRTLGHLDGVVSLNVNYRHEGPDRLPVGRGRFEISDLSWGDRELDDTIQGDLVLTGETLELRNVSGNLGQGLLRGRLVFGLTARRNSFFNIALDRVEASEVLLPYPDLADRIKGPLDVHLHGRLGREWYGGGTVVLSQGRAFGLPVNEWRVPLDFSYSPATGRGEVDVRGSHASLAQGRADGEASYSWGGGGRLNGSLRFSDVNLTALLSHEGDFSSYATGRLTGRLDFGGSDVRSVNDVTATLAAKLGQTQPYQVPVLRQLTPFLGLGQTSTFSTGEVRGTLSRGVFRIQRFTLTGNYVQLFLDGTLTTAGLLNLQATARTGVLGANGPLAAVLGPRLQAIGAIPAGVLARATTLLAGQVIRFRVGGTVRNPVVQIQPLTTLTEEAIRFFLAPAGFAIP